MKYIPNNIPQKNLRTVGEGHYTHLGPGPIEAVKVAVSMGIHPGVASTWENLLKQITVPLEGEVYFTVTDVKESVLNQQYEVYLKFFIR